MIYSKQRMSAAMGGLLVGAYLKVIDEWDVVASNQPPRGGGTEGLGELDVIGLRFSGHGVDTVNASVYIFRTDNIPFGVPRRDFPNSGSMSWTSSLVAAMLNAVTQ
jgi:hypothetical protein